VTGLQTLDRAVGLGPGDHASWAYDDVTELKTACVDYFTDGLLRHERLMYVGGREQGSLVADLAALPGRDALIDEGRLTVVSLQGQLDTADGLDATAQVEARRQMATAVVREGYAGLRVVGDITDFLARPGLLNHLVEFELAADTMMASTPLTALCAVDRERAGQRWRQVSALHRIQHSPDKHPTFSLGGAGSALRLVGEIDISSISDLDQVLDHLALATTGPLTFDLSDLSFIDVAGTRRLAEFQRSLAEEGRAVLFRRLTPAAQRTFRAFAMTEDRELW
jgi:anti-anti-sigma regulatory factor